MGAVNTNAFTQNSAPIRRYKHRVGVYGAVTVGCCVAAMSEFILGTPASGQTGPMPSSQAARVINFSQLADQEKAAPPISNPNVKPFHALPPFPSQATAGTSTPAPQQVAPLVSLPQSPPVSAGFLALLDDNSGTVPPDTHGAVGPNYIMVTLNTQFRILDRSGAAISTVSPGGFWGVQAGHSLSDPEITYDPYAGRFITSILTDYGSTAAALLIAVSQTSDPRGNWNTYRYTTNPSTATIPDQPRLGFNKTWAVLSVNTYNGTGTTFLHADLYIFDKNSLYNGVFPAPTVKTLAQSAGASVIPAVTQDASQAAEYLVQNFGSPTWRMYKISGSLGMEVLSAPASITLPSWSDVHTPSNDGPQAGTATRILINDTRMQGCVYRSRPDGSGAIWGVHNIFLTNPTRTSVQWAQLSTSNTLYQSGRIDDGSGTYFRGYPSISINGNNDALIGYSRFAASDYASTAYSLHSASDPSGTTRGENMLKWGEAPYSKYPNNVRWGDYSATVVDPLNDRDFWTVQEYATTPAGGNDRWSTWWGRVSDFRRLAAGLQHGLSQLQIGYFATSGNDVNGQLGDGANTNRQSATAVPLQTTDIAAGDYNSLAVTPSGNVLAWGSNQYGQLGNGTTGGQTNQPTQIPNLANIVTQTGEGRHIVSSNFGVCAVVDNLGQVWTWGVNYNGQLGDGTTTPHYSPMLVKNADGSTFSGAISIAAGEDQMVALKGDGTVWAWGQGAHGALGNGSTADQHYPVQVLTGPGQPLSSVAQVVSGGSNFTLTLRTDGTMYAFGANGAGQLGIGNTADQSYAVYVSWGVDKIAAGGYHCIVHSSNDGHCYAWGYNGWGQLGNPAANVNQLTPIQVREDNGNVNITDLVGGGDFSMLVTAATNGVYTVGDNQSGQLALGDTIQRNIPVGSNY